MGKARADSNMVTSAGRIPSGFRQRWLLIGGLSRTRLSWTPNWACRGTLCTMLLRILLSSLSLVVLVDLPGFFGPPQPLLLARKTRTRCI